MIDTTDMSERSSDSQKSQFSFGHTDSEDEQEERTIEVKKVVD
jgi:hypothetical protein